MAFTATPIPGHLSSTDYERFVKLLTVHYAYPLPYPLAGGFLEELFASAVGGVREKRKLLFDVLQGDTGWSLKTINVATPRVGGTFEVVLQRCDILRDRSLSLDDPVETLGARVLQQFNGFCERSANEQDVLDPRAAFLMWNNAQRDFVLFQQRYRLYTAREVSWQWATAARNSLTGFVDGRKVFRWYRSGTQLFGIYTVPHDALFFHIDWKRADLDETIAFLSERGIAKAAIEN